MPALVFLVAMVLAPASALAQPASASASPPASWPAEVKAALAQAQLPADAVSLWMLPLDTPRSAIDRAPVVAHRAQAPVNPASLMKLVTTFAALDTLGPAFSWTTDVLTDAPSITGPTLTGHVYVRSNGNPAWLWENAYTQFARLRALGIRTVQGDLVIDATAWRLPPHDPADFDQEPLRPYNVGPDATLVQYQSVALTAVPQPALGVAQLIVEPPMADARWPSQVPLKGNAPCHEWRQRLQLDWAAYPHVHAAGSYPQGCDAQTWHLAPPLPAEHTARVLRGLWEQLGGQWTGAHRRGPTPDGATLLVSQTSPPLADVIRRINKFSNNLMAEQLFLTLGAASGLSAPDTPTQARAALAQWWQTRLPHVPPPHTDNGSGLSRDQRIGADSLGRLLALAWQSPHMPDYLASLPLAGVDGTLRRHAPTDGAAHLKTGSLKDVMGIAGYLHRPDGRRLALVAIVQHPNAARARPLLNAITQWGMRISLLN